jgi:hypothetical protein
MMTMDTGSGLKRVIVCYLVVSLLGVDLTGIDDNELD